MQSQAPRFLADTAMPSQNNNASAEGRKLTAKQVRQAFVQELKDSKNDRVAFGASVMPRAVWSRTLVLAMASVGVIRAEDADGVLAVLDSELGNSSQLGTVLVESGDITREGAAQAATSLAETLRARAAAKSS
jgi:hypothetical protein